MRSRSASQRLADAAFGHHGPSDNWPKVSFTRPDSGGPSAARRGAGIAEPSSTKIQFSPAAYGVTATADGFGPYDVHGPVASDRGFTISGGCGSPKYSN